MDYPSTSGVGAACIMDLPDDCLSIIFQWLDCSLDREPFGFTCHRWLKIQNQRCRSMQCQCSFSLPNSLQYLAVFNSYHLHKPFIRFQHLRHLSLSGCTEILDSGLSPLQFCDSKLHSIFLDCCFCLYQCDITDVGLENMANGCSALTHINLSYCSFVIDNGLKSLAHKCYQLQAAKLSGCKRVSDAGLREFSFCQNAGLSERSPTLCYIDTEYCMLGPEGIVGLVSGGPKFLNVAGVSCCTCTD